VIRRRWVLTAFVGGAALAFVAGLLRKRQLVAQTGYVPPVAATGPRAVPGPATSPAAPGVPD
jgi:hypothetical protein